MPLFKKGGAGRNPVDEVQQLRSQGLEDNEIISELQMEPWTMDKHMLELTLEEQKKSFDLKRFKNNIRYAQKTGLPQVYLWGAEYWYWLKLAGQPEIWQTAQKLWLKD